MLGTVIGLVNGLVVTFTNVAPFVVTLASATLLDGVALLVHDGSTISIGTRMFALGNDKVLGVPYLLIVAVLVLIVTALVMRFTVFGRDAFAIGGNEHVARLSGINVTARKLTLYGLTGTLSGLAGLMLLSRLGSSSPGGTAYSLQLAVVAAVVIGGTSLAAWARHRHRHRSRPGAARCGGQRTEPPGLLQQLPAGLRRRRAARRGRRQRDAQGPLGLGASLTFPLVHASS